MKITCHCGHTLVDQTDNLPFKARLMPDGMWLAFWDAIDSAIENPAPSERERADACHDLRTRFRARPMYQCRKCGRICIDDPAGRLRWFEPESPDTPTDLLATPGAARGSG